MTWSFMSGFGVAMLAAGSAVAQYSYSAPTPFAERGGKFYPSTTAVVMLSPDDALARLRARVPEGAGAPGEGIIRFRTGALHKAVNCGTIDALYPNGMPSQLAGASKLPAASPTARFIAWRPHSAPLTVDTEADVEAEATVRVEPEYGGAASRITVDVAYRVTRTLTLDGVRQPPVTVAFTSSSYGEAAPMTPHAAMHPVGFGVTPMSGPPSAQPIARFGCIASGVIEKALLLEEPTLTAETSCMLGLPAGDGAACPQALARAGTTVTLTDAPAAPEAAGGASRPPR
jgi:hypothetical protein